MQRKGDMTVDKIIKSSLIVTVCAIHLSLQSFNDKQAYQMDQTLSMESLPKRAGNRPATTNTNPHTQLNQQPDDTSHVKELMNWAFMLANIERQPSAISVPGAVAMCMEPDHACDGCNAFMAGTEFAHFHPHPDYSLHLALPEKDAEHVIAGGWGEWHPLIKRGYLPPNIIMMYAPRNPEELEVAKSILKQSYDFAQGNVE